jgi:putative membrane protein
MSGATPERDAGLAAERTVLAWQRTSLALAVNGGLLLVRSPLGGGAGVVLAAAAFVLAGWVAVLGARRARVLEQDAAALAVPTRALVVLATAVAGLALGAAVAVLLSA